MDGWKVRMDRGIVLRSRFTRNQESVGHNQLLSIVYCRVRLREVEILAQAHTAKQRQSKAQKAYFCSLIFRMLSAKWKSRVHLFSWSNNLYRVPRTARSLMGDADELTGHSNTRVMGVSVC